MVIGYVRACKKYPDTDAQAAELFACGAERAYLEDGTSDALGDAFACLRQGDMLLAMSLSVFAPDRPSAYAMAARAAATGACLATLDEGIDTESRNGKPFLRFMEAMRQLEADPEPVYPSDEPAPEDAVLTGPPDYVPDWDPPEPDGTMPETRMRRPAYASAEHSAPCPAWVREPAPAACHAADDPSPWPAWVGKPATAAVHTDHRAERPAPWPVWLPARLPETRSAAHVATAYGPVPHWIPDGVHHPDRAGQESLAQPDWLPVPVIARGACPSSIARAQWPVWLPDLTVPTEPKRRRPPKPYDTDPREWIPDPPSSLPVVPRKRSPAMPEPAGLEIPPCPDPDRIGTLPPDARLRPGIRPKGADGAELIVIPSKPGAQKAIGEGVTDVSRVATERPPTAAERLLVSQMREQRRMTSIRHAVIAVIVILLVLLGILAAALPKLNAAGRLTGAAIPSAWTEPAPVRKAVPEPADMR